jgi:hypothetical protein
MKPILMLFLAAVGTNFSGTWEFSPAKSKNVGMMSEMKITATVRQGAGELVITNASVLNGEKQTFETRLDLSGKTVVNETPMGARAETVTKWDGKRLVTTWTSAGSVAGTQTVRTETRSLSDDGKTLSVESSRAKAAPMVMIYERK